MTGGSQSVWNETRTFFCAKLMGQRHAGKSYILRQIMMDLVSGGISGDKILYVSKEYTSFDFVRSYKQIETWQN